MSNTNNTMQTQTSSALHNAIMEAGGKDRPPMLAPGNYIQWKSIIKRYIDTKPNHELIHYCLKNPPYVYKYMTPDPDTTPVTPEGEVDACANAMEMWKDIERLKQGESINVQDLETNLYWEFGKFTSQEVPEVDTNDDSSSKDKEIDKLMALITTTFKKIYKPTTHNLRIILLDPTRHMACSKGMSEAKKPKDSQYHKEKIMLCKQEEAKIHLSAKKVSPDAVDNCGPIFDSKPLQKVQDCDDNYNVFTNDVFDNDSEHPGQPNSKNDTYLVEQERDLLASLIEQLKLEIDDSKQHNKSLESSNKTLGEANTFLQSELTREYYYADHMNAILGVYTKLDEFTDLHYEIETINVELEYSVAKLLQENEILHKENDTVKRHYKELYDSIKVTRNQTKVNHASLIEKLNHKSLKVTDLKAQLQDKMDVNVELRNLLNKMKGKYVDTKFVKPSFVRQPNVVKCHQQSVLGKPTPFIDSLEKTVCSKSSTHKISLNVFFKTSHSIDFA
ncbi:hypothetical protein Tco_0385758 [Tanacetum coccineum]